MKYLRAKALNYLFTAELMDIRWGSGFRQNDRAFLGDWGIPARGPESKKASWLKTSFTRTAN